MKHVEQIIENNGFIENIKLSGILFVEMWNSEFSSFFFFFTKTWFLIYIKEKYIHFSVH